MDLRSAGRIGGAEDGGGGEALLDGVGRSLHEVGETGEAAGAQGVVGHGACRGDVVGEGLGEEVAEHFVRGPGDPRGGQPEISGAGEPGLEQRDERTRQFGKGRGSVLARE